MEIVKKLAWCLLASAILTACGGGSGDTSSNTGTGINTQESNWDNAQWDNSSWK